MNDEDKSKNQLIEELREIRRRLKKIELYKHILDQIPVAIYFCDNTEKMLYRNKASVTNSGYNNEEILGLPRREYLKRLKIISPEKAKSPFSIFSPGARCKKGLFDLTETNLLNKDGTVKPVLSKGTYVCDDRGDILGACACALDLTEFKKKQQMYRLLFETIPNPVFFKDAAGLYQGCNAAFGDFVGLPKEKILGKSVYDIWPRKVADKYKAMDDALFAKPGVQVYETAAPRADGMTRDVIINKATYSCCGSNAVEGLVGIIIDVTETKRNEIMLRNALEESKQRAMELASLAYKNTLLKDTIVVSEENYRTIFNAANDAIILHNIENGDIVDGNKRAAELYGYDYEQLRSLRVADIVPDIPPYTSFKALRLIKKAAQNEPQLFEWLCKNSTNQLFWVEVNLKSAVLQGKQYVLAVIRDISERKNMEKEMAQLDRLNLVGQMAAAIGHEVRNPMTTVRGFLQLFSAKPQLADYREHFDLMIDELDRANSIIKQFLSLARNKHVEKKMANLNTIIEVIFPLIQADAFESGMNINLELGNIPDLLLDEKEIRQLILNLVRNGLEAMEKNRELTIRTYAAKNEVVLSVADQGRGVAADILNRLGTPFLTTKDDGTGLGLAVCYSIAARHNAGIDVKTCSGGTVFNVRFNC